MDRAPSPNSGAVLGENERALRSPTPSPAMLSVPMVLIVFTQVMPLLVFSSLSWTGYIPQCKGPPNIHSKPTYETLITQPP